MTTKPTIELRGVHVSERFSEETNCYTAALFVDGERWGDVGNDGHGGADRFHPAKGHTYSDLMALDARIAATFPPIDTTAFGGVEPLTPTLETVCGDIIGQWLIEKDLKRLLGRSFVYTRTDKPGVFTVALKNKGKVWTAEQIAASYARQNVPMDKALNLLPFADALAIFAKAA